MVYPITGFATDIFYFIKDATMHVDKRGINCFAPDKVLGACSETSLHVFLGLRMDMKMCLI